MFEVLPDLLDLGLVLVFCGTAASQVSARAGAYYANPGNAFWRALWQAGFTPRRFEPAEYPALLDLRIGLTDLAKQKAGSDSLFSRSDFQPEILRQKLVRFQPQIVAFTSKTAWRAWKQLPASAPVSYGWQSERLGDTRFFALPSPSGAARRYWDIEPWRALAREYRSRMQA